MTTIQKIERLKESIDMQLQVGGFTPGSINVSVPLKLFYSNDNGKNSTNVTKVDSVDEANEIAKALLKNPFISDDENVDFNKDVYLVAEVIPVR